MTTCDICARMCRIQEGNTGFCDRYVVKNGQVTERFPHQYLIACPISIETMPMLHVYPGAVFLQITTLGCNLSCPGCISTMLVREGGRGRRFLSLRSPGQVTALARKHGCLGIVFLMNDPLASYHTFLEVARAAKDHGLMIGCSTNGLFTETSLSRLLPYLDFVNLGMKGFHDASYQACGGVSAGPALRTLETLYHNHIHVEVSCMLRSDNREDIDLLAGHMASLSSHIPLQVMRFIPFGTADISLEPTIDEAETVCRELNKTLDYVYLFNSPGPGYLDTCCPVCKKTVIRRDFFGPMGAKLLPSDPHFPMTNQCPDCGERLYIKGEILEKNFMEEGFEGGYPLTRALEMAEAILVTMDVSGPEEMGLVWEDLLQKPRLQAFHHDIQSPDSYIATIRRFGRKSGRVDRAEMLAQYLEDKLAMIDHALEDLSHRPRVYYAMGTPLFALNAGRLENRLVERAGGYSVNREIVRHGRPGVSIDVAQLNDLNPEVIFISAFISDPVFAFTWKCLKAGVTADGVNHQRIYTHPVPGWDFGSPRWILGLMFIAATLHPDRFSVDLTAEAQAFYKTFYTMNFSSSTVNRSFANPSRLWTGHGESAVTP